MNKNIIITGTSRGIGFELVQLFSKAGHNVLALSRNDKPVQSLKLENVTAFSFDLNTIDAYKKVEIVADTNLSKLCKDILKIYGFNNDHLHKFYLSKNGDPHRRDNIELIEEDEFDFDLHEQDKQENIKKLKKKILIKKPKLMKVVRLAKKILKI